MAQHHDSSGAPSAPDPSADALTQGTRVRVWPGARTGRSGVTRTRTGVVDLAGVRGVYVLPCVGDDGGRVAGGFYQLSHVEEVPVGVPAPSLLVTGYEPGNGSRYDAAYARRAGGGWFLCLPEWGAVFLVRDGDARRGGSCELESRGKRVPRPDFDALIALTTELIGAGRLP